MATRFFTRSSLLTPTKQTLTSFFSRSFASLSLSKPSQSLSTTASSLSLLRLRPLVAVASSLRSSTSVATGLRGFATRHTSSSLNDPNPNWSNRPPKETILLDGCDFEHWLVVMEKPEGDPTRDEIIDSYIKTLAEVVGSEEEARMKIYSVSTRHYFAFGALVSEELSYKMKELPRVRWVLPDSYLDVRNKDYGGEPFINGQAVPYDPKYHEEWVRNNARANERNRRNDRPRNHDRSRNFERRNMGQGGPGGPRNFGPTNTGDIPPNNMGGGAPNRGGMPPNNLGGMPSNNMGGQQAPGYMGQQPSNYNMGQQPPSYNMGQQPPNYNMGQQPPHYGGQQPPNYGGQQPPSSYMGGNQHNMGGVPNNAENFQYDNAPKSGGAPYQPGPGPNQNNYAPNVAGGNPYQNQNMPGRDIPPPQNYQ
ncbi:multiple organellar RNA editing factor 8, chloroplastic/mitochondrial-like [Coffea arabica]|uniref:Multiple organellar RNA editing factor 8, chloroplastic/mitochondrial-like n=1 Tax=Coffea arabica TaxID=13443 RepID=A0ABM4UD70_COFAR